jgi:hypothetical protein
LESEHYRMKAKLLYLFIFGALFSACSKDKFTTKPQLKLKEIKTANVQSAGGTNGAILEFELEVTDAEGDVQGELYIDKVYAGQNPTCSTSSTILGLIYPVPEYPGSANQKVLVRVKFANISLPGYAIITNQCTDPDTSYFNFAITDKAGNTSDTLRTEAILLPF